MNKFDRAYAYNAFTHFSRISRTTFTSKEDNFSPFMFVSLDFNKFFQLPGEKHIIQSPKVQLRRLFYVDYLLTEVSPKLCNV